ncbi:MAG: response regulator transcription factor [Pseudomonadota bacterium]
MKKPRILLVEDDPFVASLSEAFLRDHFRVTVLHDGASALASLQKATPSLVLLDLGLPDEDGLVIAKQLRARATRLPIIFVTARGTKQDVVAGLTSGADDYIVKPFDPDELLARVNAVLRRTGTDAGDAEVERVSVDGAEIEIDLSRRIVSVSGGGRVMLTRAEFEILWALLQVRGRVLERGQLLDAISSGPDHTADERVIDALVSKIRRKLVAAGFSGAPVQTVRGIGYRARID